MLGQWEVEESVIDNYRDAVTKIFDGLVFRSMIDENANVAGLPSGKPSLLPYSKTDLSQWNYRVFSLMAINRANRRDLRSLLH
jgi:hypothetical protein